MDPLKKIGGVIRDCVELYIPLVAFAVLFLVFCFQVFMRYVVNQPQPWTLEVEQMCFLWLVLLGACYAQREKSHVTFTLLYDNLGVKGKAFTALLGNILIAVTFLAAAIPSLRYILKLSSLTSILKVPKTVVFFPFVVFTVIIFIYALMDIYEEVMVLRGSEYHIKKMLNESKSEAELAIEAAQAQELIDLNVDFEAPRKEEK